MSLSHEVDPAFREYERTVVTAFDAYVKPVIGRYLSRLEQGLAKSGVSAPLQVMQSRGGLMASPIARRRPVRLFLSGPAAGVIGARIAGGTAGDTDLITVDIGGTSCDIALISKGKALVRADGLVDGYPVRVPMVDVNSIGAGGGSIAHLDAAGGLRVGPQVGRQRARPGLLRPRRQIAHGHRRLGGAGLHRSRVFRRRHAHARCPSSRSGDSRKHRRPLGMSLHDAALGIHRVLNAQMAEGIRLVSIRQGLDPRQFALLPLGGGGAVHATALARELAITAHRGAALPRRAVGGRPARRRRSNTRSPQPSAVQLRGSTSPTSRRIGCARSAGSCPDGSGSARRRRDQRHYFADVCYIGQAYTIEVPLQLQDATPLERLYNDFLDLHARIYGHSTRTPARIVNLRSVHQAGGLDRLDEHADEPSDGESGKGMRPILVTGCPGFCSRHRCSIAPRWPQVSLSAVRRLSSNRTPPPWSSPAGAAASMPPAT